ATGSSLTFSTNGVARITVSDSSFTAGAPAIMGYGTPTADNWQGSGTATTGTSTYTVGGSVGGVSGTVVLQDNGGGDLRVGADVGSGCWTALASGAGSRVTVKASRVGATATVAMGSGTITDANLKSGGATWTGVLVYTVGGTVGGLSGTVVLEDIGGDDL